MNAQTEKPSDVRASEGRDRSDIAGGAPLGNMPNVRRAVNDQVLVGPIVRSGAQVTGNVRQGAVIDEVMVCRLLALMNKRWPEEAAAGRPDLRLVSGGTKVPEKARLVGAAS